MSDTPEQLAKQLIQAKELLTEIRQSQKDLREERRLLARQIALAKTSLINLTQNEEEAIKRYTNRTMQEAIDNLNESIDSKIVTAVVWVLRTRGKIVIDLAETEIVKETDNRH